VILALATLALGVGTGAHAAPTLRAIERGEGDGPLVVLLHGYGSRPEHVQSVADRTDLPPGTRLAFPYAPEPTRPPYGPVGGGFMWWPFETDLRDMRRASIPGIAVARERVRAFLDAEQERLGIGSERIVLGGFSQGAILALDVALHDDRPLAGVILLSGTLVDEAALTPHVASRRGLRVYLSHGTEDAVLAYEHASHLADLLRAGGLDVRMRSFEGGHSVPPEVGDDMAEFIRDVTR
jgi:phospholipase/carboxylesterase